MKKTLWIYLALFALLLMLSACESGGKFHVHNNCSFPAYVKADNGTEITIPASGDHVFKIDTDTQSIFTGEVKRDVKVWIKGETFNLYDNDNLVYTDSTWVTIRAGETLDAYLNPNRASIKVVNNSSQAITEAAVWKHAGTNHTRVGAILNIAPGTSKYLRVDFAVPNNQFYYDVIVLTEDESTYTYGDATNILGKDEQFLITHTDSE